jgi:rubrerythrin
MKRVATTKTTINTREELIYALCEAAEIEHGLTCAYLFTAFSMKKFTDEGIDEIQQDKIRNWKSVILRVAHQEMEHLGLVCNMLNAIGGPQHFDRPNFPQSKEYYQTAVDLMLSKFSLETMAGFMAFEKPDITPMDNYGLSFDQIVPAPIVIHNGHTVQELYEAILNGFIYLDGKIDLFIGNKKAQIDDSAINVGFSDKEYGITMMKIENLEQAKAAIVEIIEQGEGIILQGDAVLTENKALTKLYEQFDALVNNMNAVPVEASNWPRSVKEITAAAKGIVVNLQESLPYIRQRPEHRLIIEHALSVISPAAVALAKLTKEPYSKPNAKKAGELRSIINNSAINDAEGAVIYEIVEEKDCHYLKFWDLYQDLKKELEKPGRFDPSRNVADNPMLRRHQDTLNSKNIHIVEYEYTRKVLELFNAGYETMVDMLILFFANDGISKNERNILMNTAFFPFMTMFIRPVGEILSMLPLVADEQRPLEVLRAGGSYEFYINIALMPRTKPEWTYLGERLKEMVTLSKTLQKPDEDLQQYLPGNGFAYLQEQMVFLYTNMNRICENFFTGMKIKK